MSTEAIQNKLDLRVEKTETLKLNYFGSENVKHISLDRVLVNVEVGSDLFIPVTDFSNSHICTPLAAKVNLSAYSNFSGLELADCFDSVIKQMGILIGLDHF